MNILVIVSAANKKEAKAIAQAAIKKKLAACANILEGVHSLFWWQGKVDSAGEVMVLFKTKRSLFERLRTMIKAAHSYDVPEIIALPIVAGDKEYLRWIGESVR